MEPPRLGPDNDNGDNVAKYSELIKQYMLAVQQLRSASASSHGIGEWALQARCLSGGPEFFSVDTNLLVLLNLVRYVKCSLLL